MNEIFSKLEDEAYARVMWGDRASEIEEWLIQRGIPESDAKEMIRRFQGERRLEIRKSGLRKLGIGLLSLTGSALAVAAFVVWGRSATYIIVPRIVIGLIVLGVIFGLAKVGSGVFELLFGSANGGISDLDD